MQYIAYPFLRLIQCFSFLYYMRKDPKLLLWAICHPLDLTRKSRERRQLRYQLGFYHWSIAPPLVQLDKKYDEYLIQKQNRIQEQAAEAARLARPGITDM